MKTRPFFPAFPLWRVPASRFSLPLHLYTPMWKIVSEVTTAPGTGTATPSADKHVTYTTYYVLQRA